MQDAQHLTGAKVEAKLQGPVTLGTDSTQAETLAQVSQPLDDYVWSANDTTGQASAEAARRGGRAVIELSRGDFAGAPLRFLGMC